MIKKKGFTLVELLVVIAIIALLLSILMPSLGRAKKQAKDIVCRSNIKQWGIYFSLYTNEHNGSFQGEWSGAHPDQTWLVTLFNYYKKNPQILLCPEGDKPETNTMNYTSTRWTVWSGHFPPQAVPKTFYKYITTSPYLRGSYGINWFVANVPSDAYLEGAKRTDFWRRVDAKGGNQVPMFMDNMQWIMRPFSGDRAPNPEGFTTGFGWDRACINRHNGYVNSVFLDCSVRRIGLKELWKMKWYQSYTPVKPTVWPDWMKKFKEYN